jgi:hypothetical protein
MTLVLSSTRKCPILGQKSAAISRRQTPEIGGESCFYQYMARIITDETNRRGSA